MKKYIGTPGFFLLLIITLLSLIGPMLRPFSYSQLHMQMHNLPPNSIFWFGTDELGRDIFTRVCIGGRISLYIGLIASFIDLLIGTFFGVFAGSSSAKIDELLMRFCDLISAIPDLLLAIFFVCIFGNSITSVILAVSLPGWINTARVIRAQVKYIKKREYVLAAKALGASRYRILLKHILPNCLSSIITSTSLAVPIAIFIEASISFLNLGIQAPMVSLGLMLSDGLAAITYYPWKVLFPALFISFTMLGFMLTGNYLRDIFDPKRNI